MLQQIQYFQAVVRCGSFTEAADYYYNNIHTKNGGRASDCIKCGQCETLCPQHLEIRRLPTKVASEFDR